MLPLDDAYRWLWHTRRALIFWGRSQRVMLHYYYYGPAMPPARDYKSSATLSRASGTAIAA